MNDQLMMGHNVPDYAAEETGRLEREFRDLQAEIGIAVMAANGLAERTVEDEETANQFTEVITRLRDLDKKVEGFRNSEKTPHLRKSDAVDNFFFKLRERLFRRKRTDSAGAADTLQDRLHAYNERRLAEERRRREEAERAARAAEAEARRLREEADRKARAAAEAAARKRNEESRRAAAEEAAKAAAEAAKAAEAEENARSTASAAAADAAARPADLVRERHQGGAMNTMKRVGYAEITDPMKLDALALWPFVPEDAKRKALLGWAKTTQFSRQMEGAAIGFRNETVVRR